MQTDSPIYRLTPDDIGVAKQLFWFYQEDDGVAEPVVPSDEYLHNLLAKDDFHVLVARENEILKGGLTAYELAMYKQTVNEMFLYEIAVKPEWRQKGIGAALIEELKVICREKGIKELYVGTSTPNKAAMNLYRATGGEQESDIAWFVYQV